MVRVGYHASHEQFAPSELLKYAIAAEEAGFASIMSSDHLAPWSERQGHSGHAWAWLGAAMQATSLPFGLITIPSGFRYHPVVTAQAAATIAELFPGRLPWLAVGSGQALNEHVVAHRWPAKHERNERLFAGVQVIRELWAGETVNRSGPIAVDEARIYVRPSVLPRIIAGALSPETAKFAGEWADGLITISQPREQLARIIDAFQAGGGSGKPLYLQVHASFAETDARARANAHDQWRSNAITADMAETLRLPEEFDRATAMVRPEDMDMHVRISSSLNAHLDWLREDVSMGFEEIYLHNVGRNQQFFIEQFGSHVLPQLHKTDL